MEFSDEPIGSAPMSKIGARKFYDVLPVGKKSPAINALSGSISSTKRNLLLAEMAKDPEDWYVSQHFLGGMAVRNFLRSKGFGEDYWPIWNLDDIYVFLLEDALRRPNDGSAVMTPMPRYQCHKKVWALKIRMVESSSNGNFLVIEDAGYAPVQVDEAYLAKHQPQPGGYYVVYDDGYKSFSPAKAFEDGYTRL